MTRQANPITARRRAGAFTLIELLVVVAIILLLVGILIPTGIFVLGNARKSSNLQLMRTISDGVDAFKNDFRYIPPLLAPQPTSNRLFYTPDHTLRNNHQGSARTANDRQLELRDRRWHSVAALPIYLMGIGDLAPDIGDSTLTPAPRFLQENEPNYENRHDGADGLGIRDPGPDRSWGGAADRGRHLPTFQGRVYGPYIDPKIAESNMRLARAEDFPYRNTINPPLTQDVFDELSMFVFVDRYDSPIRYYKEWLEREPGVVPGPGEPDTSLRLAPLELLSYETVTRYRGVGQGTLSESRLVDGELVGKPFALLSAGPDGRWGERRREEIVAEPLLVGENIDSLSQTATGGISERARVFNAIKDNQRVTP